MKKFFGILLFLPLVLFVFLGFSGKKAQKSVSYDKDVFSCLLVGFDEAAENTDAISVISYSKSRNSITVLQIPRDSYCVFENVAGKLNSVYPRSRSTGHDTQESMCLLMRKVENALDVKLDGYAGFSAEVFLKLIDDIGGVWINVPENFPLDAFDGKIKHGKNLINGDVAMLFVRHRASYGGGDLSRLDAQKIFFEGFIKTLFEKADIKTLISMLSIKDDGAVIDMPIFKLSELLMFNLSAIKKAEINTLTLPGTAATDGGVSYYIVNRTAASHAIQNFLFAKSASFDKDGNFTNKDNDIIFELYGKKMNSYTVYKDGKKSDVKI